MLAMLAIVISFLYEYTLYKIGYTKTQSNARQDQTAGNPGNYN
jgi:hypothetical protein